jgi:hypothetical protein
MKKLFLSLTFMLTIVAGTALANDKTDVSELVSTTFKKEFPSASLIEWSSPGEYLKATFILWGSRAEAYFTADGQLQGSMRSIFYNQLPLSVMITVDKRFETAEILTVSEISNSEGTSYLLVLESKNKKYRVKVNSSGGIAEVKRIKKQ